MRLPPLLRPLVLLMLALSAPAALGQQPAPKEDPAQTTAAALAASRVALAAELAAYGRAEGAPEALVAAARILLDHPAQSASDSDVLAPHVLLDEAEALTDDEALRAVIEGLRAQIPAPPQSESQHEEEPTEGAPPPPPAQRAPSRAAPTGAAGGSIYYTDTAPAQATKTHAIIFEGGETARLVARGNGTTDLDYRLYDAADRLVGSDESTHDRATFQWYVPFTQRYRLEIVNLGTAANTYVLVTN